MKSQVLTLLLLTIGALLFQSTHQYRLQKRELTEYDLTSFIVNTCSADKVEMLIQNLCDQTLESALMGNFPFLMYYCKTIGSGNRYCDNINRQTLAEDQNIEAERFPSRRLARSLNKDKQSIRKGQETDTDLDLKQKEIIALCMVKPDKNSLETHRFCDQTLKKIQQGQYPEIKRLCKSHHEFNYCRHVLSFSLLEESSSLLSSSPSITPNINLSSVPLESSKLSDVKSKINPEEMNKNTNKLPLL